MIGQDQTDSNGDAARLEAEIAGLEDYASPSQYGPRNGPARNGNRYKYYDGPTLAEELRAAEAKAAAAKNGQPHDHDGDGPPDEPSDEPPDLPDSVDEQERPRTKPFSNYLTVEVAKGEKTVEVKVGLPAVYLGKRLREQTGDWPRRVGPLLFVVEDHKPLYLIDTADLFAWIGRQMPVADHNLIKWAQGDDKVSQAVFFSHLQQTCTSYASVEPYPHWPPLKDCYYAHPPLRGGDGKALEWLLGRFKPATLIDGDLNLGYFLSLMSGLPPGSRPTWTITASSSDAQAGRGVGKTTLLEMGGRLFGGYIAGRPGEDVSVLMQRLLSPAARGIRQLIIDNLKSLRFSSDQLESLATAEKISGKMMYVGEAQIPNTLTLGISVNGASFSKDFAQRSNFIELARPDYSPDWREETVAFIDERRWDIFGDLKAILQEPAQSLGEYCRWGAWEKLVLSRLPEPSDAQMVLQERRAAVDDDQEETALIREGFVAELRRRLHDPVTANVFIPSRIAADIVNAATGEKRPTNKATSYLKTLSLPELRKSDRGEGRGWVWSGKKAGMGDAVLVNDLPFYGDGG
jgi:hypothetical protein